MGLVTSTWALRWGPLSLRRGFFVDINMYRTDCELSQAFGLVLPFMTRLFPL